MKKQRMKRMSIAGEKKRVSTIGKFRADWRKKGYELVDITQLCEFKLGNSGWCSDFNEPSENCYHIQAIYRDECIANFDGKGAYAIDETKHVIYMDEEDFIIFRLVPEVKR